ncbi:MAG: nucleotide exchange factor GrpE [Aeromicrobium sp.]|nr:nucleotide exchange factor GrpE [Burkholderiales bacterium]
MTQTSENAHEQSSQAQTDQNEASAGAIDPAADFAIKLATAEAAATTAKDEWLRAKAETENIRRRSAEDVLKAQKYGVEKIADALLAVKDSLDAALQVESPSVDAYKQGVELTARQLSSVFEKFSIQEVDPLGQKFDPSRHQSLAAVESAQEPNTVVSVMQKGYTLHERVLRPALVAVSKAN